MPAPPPVDLLDRLRAALAGRYRLERELGRGGMAVVYLARDVRHGREVAIKVLPPELSGSVGAERFLREIQIAARLQHPNILGIHDSGEADGLLYYVMPYVRGESLRALLDREKQLGLPDVIRITRQIAEGLTYAHAQGVVHRDIKPHNVLLADGYALIADFGVARAVGGEEGETLTATGMAVGTPLYMSPEQCMGGAVDARSDIYALGCVVYEMLAGEPPFTGPSSQAIVARHAQAQPPSLRVVRETVSLAAEAAVEKALRKVPADRYRTALEFAEALEKALREPAARAAGFRVGRKAAIGAAAAVLAIAATWFGITRLGGAGPPVPGRIAVAPFDILDPGLGEWREGLTDLVSQNLDGAGPLRAVPATTVRQQWSGTADAGSLLRLLRRTGAELGVLGRVMRAGQDSARLTVRILEAGSARVLGEIEVTSPVARMDQAADSVTIGVLQALSRTRPIGAVQAATVYATPLPALKAYLRGEQYFRRTVWDSALQHYQTAVARDTGFALALHRIFQVREFVGTGNDSLVWDYALRAGRLARGLAPRESLLVTMDSLMVSLFHTFLRGDTLARVRRQRLLATAELAARRFPDDPEVWFQLGAVRRRVGWALGVPHVAAFEALDRALTLDPGFGPAHLRVLDVILVVRGLEATRQALDRYLALGPSGLEAAAARLTRQLLDPRTAFSPEVQQTLDTAQALLLFAAQRPIEYLVDSAETMIRLGRHMVRRSFDPHFGADPGIARYLLAIQLAFRGRLREAVEQGVMPGKLYAELALLGGLPADSVARTYAGFLRAPLPSSELGWAMPWWSRQGDTASLATLVRVAEAAAGTGPSTPVRRFSRYLADAGRAWLALTRGDTAEALPRFLALPDTASPSGVGDLERLTTVQLLRATGRHNEAAARLRREVPSTAFPDQVLWTLERARVAEALGDRAAALTHYRFVADAWRHADDVLQPVAREAREAASRLSARPPD